MTKSASLYGTNTKELNEKYQKKIIKNWKEHVENGVKNTKITELPSVIEQASSKMFNVTMASDDEINDLVMQLKNEGLVKDTEKMKKIEAEIEEKRKLEEEARKRDEAEEREAKIQAFRKKKTGKEEEPKG